MDVKMMPISAVRPYSANPRHNEAAIDKVAASIREFGFRQPIVVDAGNVIIIGHTRLLAAQSLKLKTVPVHVAKLSDAKVRALRLADNRLHEDSTWNFERLAHELGALSADDMALTGFTAEELAALLQTPIDEGAKDPDAPPALPKEVRSALGDVWICGAHRVACADATSAPAVAAAMKNAKADVVWTDPPYNVAYTGKTADALTIQNDAQSPAAFLAFLRAVFRILAGVMKAGASIYVAHAPTEGTNFGRALMDGGFKLSGVLAWVKDSMVLGRSDYQWQHESILYGWKAGGSHRWYGGRKQTTVLNAGAFGFTQMPDGRWQLLLGDRLLIVTGDARIEEMVPSVIQTIARPKRSLEHPTMKPVELIERMLKNSARTGQLVFDPFGGSGSTLIAAERLAMPAVLTEIDPRYVDVIVSRWQEYSGRRAHREADKVEFDEVAPRPLPPAPAPAAAGPVIRTGLRRPIPIKRAIRRAAKRGRVAP